MNISSRKSFQRQRYSRKSVYRKTPPPQPMDPNELKAICKKYRQKKSSFGDTVDGDPINDEHDETGDELHEDEDGTTSLSLSQENLSQTTEDQSVTTDSLNLGETEKMENNGTSTTPNSVSSPPPDSPVNHDAGIDLNASISSTKNENENEIHHEEEVKNNEKNNQNGDRHKKHSSNGHVARPSKEDHKSLRDNIKHGFHRPISSPFKQAHDLFRKKKKKKIQRVKHPSYHLNIPDREEGETTTDFDSDESVDELEDADDDIVCPCTEHVGKNYIDEEFNFDVDTLHDHLFSQESDMMKRVYEQRTFLNWNFTAYEKHATEDYFEQTLSYTLPLNYSIGPKESFTISKQMMPLSNKPGQCIIVNAENTSQGVPYSDSFVVIIKYCMTRAVGNRSRLKVHGELKYTKRVFGLVKNMITKSGDEACRDYFNYLVTVLKSESELVPPSVKLPKKRKVEKKKSNEVSTAISSPPVQSAVQQKDTTKVQTSGFWSNLQLSSTTIIGFLIAMLLLLSMNLYLFGRLKTLEGSVLVHKNSWLPSEMPKSDVEWTKLLDYQKGLHDLELLKLKEVIGNTASLVKQIETSISSLHDELERSATKQQIDASNAPKDEL